MADNGPSGWEKFWQAITFPRFVTLVGLFFLGALVFSIWSNGAKNIVDGFGGWFDHAGQVNFARGLITFLVVACTITIALLLVIFGLFFSKTDDKEFWKARFSLGKEVLTLFMGILGTIMGFYYAENMVSTESLSNLNDPVEKSSPIGDLEKKAFVALLAKDFDNASQHFANAYKINPTYHNVGEISKILNDSKDRFTTAGKDTKQTEPIWNDIFCTISEGKFTLGMSEEMTAQVRKSCPRFTVNANTALANTSVVPTNTGVTPTANANSR
jgi:hypothetical protein